MKEWGNNFLEVIMNTINKNFLRVGILAFAMGIPMISHAISFNFWGTQFNIFAFSEIIIFKRSGALKTQGSVIPAYEDDCFVVSGDTVLVNGKAVDTTIERSGVEEPQALQQKEYDVLDIPDYIAEVKQLKDGQDCFICDSSFLKHIAISEDNGILKARLNKTEGRVAYNIGDKPMCIAYLRKNSDNVSPKPVSTYHTKMY